MSNPNLRWWTILGPGLLVAATGVGAGDLATGAFTGNKLGVAILWAVVVGAALKFVLNEGLARWQLATEQTLLEGAVLHLGRFAQWLFLAYLLIWSFSVCSALMSACGVTFHALLPWFSATTDKIIYGMLHSAVAVCLVIYGGYRLFEKVMRVCIAMMFVVVVVCAVMLKPAWSDIATGMVWPTIPQFSGEGLQWTIALLGGVGGTLTVLCYGYWIREEGRNGPDQLRICRWDLAAGYFMTALFGMSMVIIGSQLDLPKSQPASLMVHISDRLQQELGTFARWLFLAGAWGAVFSSLLGVWQSVPYLFADFWQLTRSNTAGPVNTRGLPYRVYLFCMATIPCVGLFVRFDAVQKTYAIIGALFIPLLAIVLLILNSRPSLVGQQLRNSHFTNALLILTLLCFLLAGWFEIQNQFAGS